MIKHNMEGPHEQLAAGRARIDRINSAMLRLYAERIEAVDVVAEAKEELGEEPYQPERFYSMMQGLVEQGAVLGIPPDQVEGFFSNLHTASVERQEARRAAKQLP